MTKKSSNLWSEVNKVRNKKFTFSNNIDDIQGDDNIAELFSEKYAILYNSVTYEQTVMDELLRTNEKDVKSHCVSATDDNYIHTHVINVDQVTSAVHKLKSGKFDCIDDLLSDNFKNGILHLFNIISLLFTAMLNHGVAPTGLLLSTLFPIPKNKRGNKCDSDNYRQIAISSLLGKLFDIIVLEEQADSLFTDLLQFGFKKNSATVNCTSMLLETIGYYNEIDTDCYVLFIGCMKSI